MQNEAFQNVLKQSAAAATDTIFELEPLILESNDDVLTLSIQIDNAGKDGDVRDILIARKDIRWEIGLSVKHNHFAVKHSRLAKTLDFGEKWFGKPCSCAYWDDVRPIFQLLSDKKEEHVAWSDLKNKESAVYVPLLKAFVSEVKRSDKQYSGIPKKMVEYLLGEFDFYKIISIDKQKMAQVQAFNLRGKLNQSGERTKPNIIVPKSALPTRIVSLDFKPNSDNTVELYLDGGWQFSFRIHNASTIVEPSLKFDVQIVGMPTTIITINCLWR